MSMHAYFKSVNLEGFANWMYYQAQEELTHSLKFYNFIISRGGRVALAQVEAPPSGWNSPLSVFKATLEHEQKVTGLINELVELALQEHDHATNIFLQWFVTEQVEEEENVSGVLEQLKLMGEAKGGLFMIDRELTKRSAGGGSESAQ
jgi:ferritin